MPLIPETTIYLGTAGSLLVGALLFGAVGIQSSGETRQMVLWATVPAIGMGLAYIGMGLEFLTVETAESAANALAFAGYLGGSYALVGPVSRIAGDQVAARRLLYAKLRNLFVLCWGVLIIQSSISDQSLGFTDLFVGQLGASYTDVLFMIGIGGLVVANRHVFGAEE